MKHRLFIAIDLPETTLSEIAALQPQLDKLELPIVWEKHLLLTLNFLGLADPGAITPLIPSFHSFALQPLYLDTLYSRHEPTILYLSLAKSPELTDLQSSLSLSLSQITPQPRKFLPHITLGHLKRTDPVSTKRYMDILSDFNSPQFSPFTVDKIVLYQSLISQAGTTYQKLATFSPAIA
ncbi:MAG: RNA 2',3'-cyclic phosphodiesterase [Patescibacteria group bacterium]